MRLKAIGAALLAGVALATAAQAQDWPKQRQITLVSPYPPGGTNDIVARLFADKLAASIGQSIVVDGGSTLPESPFFAEDGE